MAIGIVDPFEVVKVKQQHGAEFALSNGPGTCLDESIVEECTVREPRERIVQRLE